jgi:acyl-CoA reductase-like NAD-dependent aldehyde dehydrogenase
VLASSKFWCCT